MKASFKLSGLRKVVIALLVGMFAIGTWQTVSAKENPNDNFLTSVFGSISNLFAENKTNQTSLQANYAIDDQVIGTCDTAGPIEVESTGGTTAPTAYATLKGAFDAITVGTHTGAINIEVCGNTTETATASLDASGTGSSSYTSVTIRPVGAGRIIEGSIIGAIVKLNGADNVTIDGRQGGTGTARDLTIRNNNTSGSTAAIWLASVAAGNGAANNTIRNLEIAAGAPQNTGTNSTFGIIMCGTTIGTTTNGVDNDNNSFIANRIIKARYGIVTRGTTTDLNINPVVTDNIIGPTAFGADEIGKVGILMQADTGALVSRNTIQFVGGDFANTTSGADRIGIGIGSESWSASAPGTLTSNTYTVTRNVVRDIVEQRTFSSVGINLGTTGGGSATNNLVANNFIFNIVSNGTSGDQPVGIGIAGGFSDNVVFNSISMTGDMDGTGASAAATYGNAIRIANASGTTHQNLNLKDNSIYMDVNSNTTTIPYFAITVNSATYAFGTGGLNYNNYYINQANTQMNTGGITSSGTAPTAALTYKTLANWQAALTPAQDQNSIQSDPLYVSNTSDLHISAGSPNVNAGIAAAGVTTDFDGQLRVAAPDIGADEPAGIAPPMNDIAATAIVNPANGSTVGTGIAFTPQASYTNNGTNAQTNVTVRFRILNSAMVEVYNQTATIASIAPGATVTVNFPSATLPAAGTYTTIASSELAGDENTANNSVQGTVNAVAPLSGTYNVGAGETFTSLTNAGGIFDSINSAGATGNIVINITSDLTGENGAVALNEIAGGFTVTIKPVGASRSITGSSTTGIIRLNGADNVTIDGSLTGATGTGVGGTASLRNLTVQNTNAAATAGAVIAVTQGANSANNVTIKNVNVSGQDPTQTLLGIHIGGNTIGGSPTVASNTNIVVDNCAVQKAILGIFNNGVSAAIPATGSVISRNDLSATGANRLRRAGIFFFNQNGIQVTENKVGGIVADEAADAIGIIAGIQNVTTTATTSGGVYNANISKNLINVVTSTSTTGFSAVGIAVAGDPLGANTVSNNMISGVSAPSTSPDFVAGIFVAGVTNSNTKLYYNSVSNTGARGAVASQIGSYGLAISGTNPIVELKNNIFYNTQTSGGGANAKSYAIGMTSTTFTNLDSNYNDFFTSGANAAGFRTGSLDTTGTDLANLAAWQAAVSDDANSQEVDPLFVDPISDLHLQAATPLENDGTPVAGITDDIDGNPRSATTPEIGADELFVAVPGTLAFSSATYSVGEGGGTVTLTVNRTGGTDGAVTVDYALGGGTATGGATCGAGVDYVNTGGTVSFANGEASKTINVTICEDSTFEGDETFSATLSNATGGATIGTPNPATVTITENKGQPTVQFSSSTYSTTEPLSDSGVATGATITVTLSGVSQSNVTVNYATSNGTATGGAACAAGVDYVTTSGTLTFNAGETSKTFFVPTCVDTAFEGNETVNLTLSNPTNATLGTPNSAILTIVENDPMPPTGPVTVTATAGTGSATYNNLTEAIAAVNAGTHQGAIVININQTITEPGTVVINGSGAGAALYTSILIQPGADNVTDSGASVQGRGLIELNGADNVTINGDNPNTAGTNRNLTLQNTATNTVTFTSVIRVAVAATGVTSADNNAFRNLNILGSATGRNIATATSTTASENTTFGIFAGPGASTTDGTAAPAAVASVSTSVAAGATATNLIVSNNNIRTAARAVSMNGAATSVFPGLQITGNAIGNPTAGDADQIYSIGITAQGSLDAVIRDNTIWIEGFIASSAATHGINVGVNSTAITGATIERNKINRVQNNNGQSWSAFGINLGGGSNHVVQNNFISGVINSQTAGTGAFGSTFGAYGIRIASGTGHKVYHNSVNLYGVMPGATSTNLTAAFLMSATTQTGVDVRNNIFANQITGGNPTGTRNVAVFLPSGGTSAMNLTINNNAYYGSSDANSRLAQVGTTFGSGEFTYGNFDPTSTTPATNFRAYTSTLSAAGTNDNASFATTAPPPFTSNTDLHIPAGSATRLESGGAAVGVTTDIDLEARNATTPDIGADEFTGNPAPANDIAAVGFVYPVNGSTIPTGTFNPIARFNNNGTATQTNVTVRFRILNSSMTEVYNQTATIASIAPLQNVDVTFPTATISTAGTYTMIASVENPGDANPANDSITGTFNTIVPLGGTINVGAGETYTSLTNPGGVFQALNTAGISGNTTINITSDLTAETGAVALNQLAESGAGGYTVTFKPSGAARVISGTGAASNGLINLNGADRIVFDGSLSGGTDRSLTITNNQTGTSTVFWIKSASAANGANNNTIKNCIINGAGTTTAQTTAGILAGSGTTIGGPAEAQNNNNTITNNWIYRVQNSFYNQGNTGFDQNWSLTNNEFGSTVEADKNRFRGMLMGNANNFVISGNTVLGIGNFDATTGALSGIQLAFAVTNGTVTKNRISNVRNLSTGGTGAFGMQLSATPTTNITIANNFIWDIQAVGSATVTSNGHGITINGAATAGGYKIYYNSVNLNTNQTSGTTAALNITSAVVAAGAIDLRNNILANTQTAGATRFAVFSAAAANVFSTIDYNDYFAQNVGSLGGTTRTTLADWQAATGQDANSKAVDPLFVSATDLHLQAGSPVLNMGTPIAGITDDIDGETRSATTTDIGADEVAAVAAPGTLQFSSPTYSIGEAGGTQTVTVTRTGGSDGTVTVNYATGGGTATGGAACGGTVDYVSASGTLTFAAGVTSQTFNVTICNDTADEPDETFNYTLSNPTGGATIGTPATAVQTIVDDDGPAASFTLSISDAKVVEADSGTTNAVFTVTLANIPTNNIGGTIASVQYSTANGTAIAGSDYVATSGTLNFTSTGTQTITVPVIGDTLKEANETFFVNLSNPSSNATIADGQGVGIIVDRDRTYLADYDRDYISDFSVYRPSNSTFYVSKSTKGFPLFQSFGFTGVSVPGDYDGDGKVDFALWDSTNGNWSVIRSSDQTTIFVNWGLPSDKPVQGDFTGDGKTDFAVFRPSTGVWYVLPNSTTETPYALQFGISTDRPVQADYDGDFKTDIAVYRDGVWYILNSSNNSVSIQSWGLAADKPAVGDFDGDGKNDLTVYRDGIWYIRRTLTNDFIIVNWGLAGDVPVPADYDADGTSDIAVFRPSGGDWYVIRSSNNASFTFHWGQSGDVPTPAAYLPQ